MSSAPASPPHAWPPRPGRAAGRRQPGRRSLPPWRPWHRRRSQRPRRCRPARGARPAPGSRPVPAPAPAWSASSGLPGAAVAVSLRRPGLLLLRALAHGARAQTSEPVRSGAGFSPAAGGFPVPWPSAAPGPAGWPSSSSSRSLRSPTRVSGMLHGEGAASSSSSASSALTSASFSASAFPSRLGFLRCAGFLAASASFAASASARRFLPGSAALAWSAAASRQAKRGPNVPASAPSPAAPSSAWSCGSSSSPADGEPGRLETLGAQALH